MLTFKKFLYERTKQEIVDDLLTINDIKILNQVDAVLSKPLIEEKVDNICKDKKLPKKSVSSIMSFFIHHHSDLDEKFILLAGLENGLIHNLSSGTFNGIDSLVESKITKLNIWGDFVDFVGALGDAKEGQGATGTGKGEILLAMLCKDGYLPASKGDVNLLGLGFEVKAQNGIIATWSAWKEKEKTEQFFSKILKTEIVLDENNIKGLCSALNAVQDKTLVKEAFKKYFEARAVKTFVQKMVPEIVNKINFNKLVPKDVQTIFGETLVNAYKIDHGWDGIIIFKESKNLRKTKITIGFNINDFNKYISYNGLNMSNGTQDAALTVAPK